MDEISAQKVGTGTCFGKMAVYPRLLTLTLYWNFFFLEHTGELRIIIVLIEEKESHTPEPLQRHRITG
jgi:hypothetical protein